MRADQCYLKKIAANFSNFRAYSCAGRPLSFGRWLWLLSLLHWAGLGFKKGWGYESPMYEIYHKLKVLNSLVSWLTVGKVSSKFTLLPIIMGSVENYPKWKETNIGDTPSFHWTMIMGGRVRSLDNGCFLKMGGNLHSPPQVLIHF